MSDLSGSGPSRKESAAGDDKRQAILKASAKVIAERGVRGLRVHDVAEAAGVSPGLPFYHFADRTGLLTAALGFINERSRELRLNEPLGDSPRANLIAQALGEIQDDPRVIENSRAWNELRASAIFEADLRGPVAETTNMWVDEIAAVVSEVIDAGEAITDLAPVAAAREITTLIEGVSGRWLTGELSTAQARESVRSSIDRLLPTTGGPRPRTTSGLVVRRTFEVVSALEPAPVVMTGASHAGRRLRVAVVQQEWNGNPRELSQCFAEGIAVAAGLGAQVVFLPQAGISTLTGTEVEAPATEDLLSGPTREFATEMAARFGVVVQASLLERATECNGIGDGMPIVVSPNGELVRAAGGQNPVHVSASLDGTSLAVARWTDERLAEEVRTYAQNGAEVVAVPCAIASDRRHSGFDPQPMWEQAVVASAIASGVFIAVASRVGAHGDLTFFGSSFICDPFGRVLVQAARDRASVLVAELDLAQRTDWLALSPFSPVRRLSGAVTVDEGA